MTNFLKSLFGSKTTAKVSSQQNQKVTIPIQNQQQADAKEKTNITNEFVEVHVKLAGFADDYYKWSEANPEGELKDYEGYSEVRSIGQQPFDAGGKRKMLIEYSHTKKNKAEKY
jgi:hypothetical protein